MGLKSIKDRQYQSSTTSSKPERKRKIDHVQFKNVGNEDQYNHAKQVMEKMDEIEEALHEKRLEDVKKVLRSIEEAFAFRMKLIKITEK